MKPTLPEMKIERSVREIKPPTDPVHRLDWLLRLSKARESVIVRTTPLPEPTWIERNGIGILVAVVGGGLFGYLLGVLS